MREAVQEHKATLTLNTDGFMATNYREIMKH